jgi:hypothetical protein
MTVWGRARKKPVEIDFREPRGSEETIFTLEGELRAKRGHDYVIRGVQGELYPIDIDIFNQTYEVVRGPSCSLCGHPKGSSRKEYGDCNCSCHRGD